MCRISLTTIILCLIMATYAKAQTETIDISGNNTSSSYVSYSKAISLPAGKTVEVRMARYCYFSSTISGRGTLHLLAGGERCYLGTEKGAQWPNWTNFSGDIHIYPFAENSASAGFYGVVLAHGGKSFSPESIEEGLKSGKVNTSMQSNHVTLHTGATICCEANTAGAGFRIGELQTEAGSTLQGYMKNQRAAYYLLGSLGTDATLAGTIAPSGYRDDTPLGIIKEGKGTLRITGNDNYLSGALRVLEGCVRIDNDIAKTKAQRLRGALGARPNATEAIAYVFANGMLGGTGSIAGSVDNYGTINPGDSTPGTLTIQNFAQPALRPNLTMHPASVLRCRIDALDSHDRIDIAGNILYSSMTEDFSTATDMPVVEVASIGEGLQVGDEFVLLTANGKTGNWHFDLRQPERYTWQLDERDADGQYQLVLRLVSLADASDPDNPSDPDHPSDPGTHMGAFYDDGIDDTADATTLRQYAQMNGKLIGTAVSTWTYDVGNESLAETKEIATQFNMIVAENEMKMDALQPSRGSFSFGGADKIVSFAQRHQMTVRGHCLVWHMQQPQWLSSDGKKNDKNWTRDEALQLMRTHIETVVKHFKGKVAEWDVVNECLDDDQSIIRSNPDGYTLRQTVWLRAIGDDYIDSAFVYAHRADPTAILYLNDYDVEHQGRAKSVAFLNLARRLKHDGIPIDGVGLQCHFSVGDVDSLRLDQTMRRFADEGMKCIITEMDMGVASTSAANLEEQARNYRIVTDIMLNNDNCPCLVIWGLKDNDSWRSASNPLLYTSGLQKKTAWYAVRSALRHRTLTTPSAIIPVERTAGKPSGTTYDLSGRRIDATTTTPGIYIVGGRKVVVR